MVGINDLAAKKRSTQAAGKNAPSSVAVPPPKESGQRVKPYDPIRDV
jgi:hypothetical protein